jgi:hypothetical protein
MNSSTIWPLIYPRDLIFSWHWEVAIDGYSHSHLKKLQRNGIWGIFLVYDEGNMCWHGSPCFCNSKMFQRFGMSQNFAAVHFCTFGSRSIAISTSIGMCFRASMWARGSSWTFVCVTPSPADAFKRSYGLNAYLPVDTAGSICLSLFM